MKFLGGHSHDRDRHILLLLDLVLVMVSEGIDIVNVGPKQTNDPLVRSNVSVPATTSLFLRILALRVLLIVIYDEIILPVISFLKSILESVL